VRPDDNAPRGRIRPSARDLLALISIVQILNAHPGRVGGCCGDFTYLVKGLFKDEAL